MTTVEYVLGRMDRWYENKVRKNYTKEVERNAMATLVQGAGVGLDDLVKSTLADLVRERQIKTAGCYFSLVYKNMEIGLEETPVEEMLEARSNQYMGAIIEQVEKLKGFVDGVRKIASEIGPEDVTDEILDREFLKYFGGVEGYIEFNNALIESTKPLLDFMCDSGDVPREELGTRLKILDATKKASEYISRQLFPDLR